jgi:hypothetical protein
MGGVPPVPGVPLIKATSCCTRTRAWECISNLSPRFLSKKVLILIQVLIQNRQPGATFCTSTNTYINTNMY